MMVSERLIVFSNDLTLIQNTTQNVVKSAEQNEVESGGNKESESLCLFARKRGRQASNRKKEKTDFDSVTSTDDSPSSVVIPQTTNLRTKNNPLLTTTRKNNASEREDSLTFSYQSDRSSAPHGPENQGATLHLEIETEEEIKKRRRISQDETVESGDPQQVMKIYRGMANYPQYIEPKEIPKTLRAGPVRSTCYNVRSMARFDYQPDICKDYKETGFCGYGDNCIYLHDRGLLSI
jgi:RING finger protein 113A